MKPMRTNIKQIPPKILQSHYHNSKKSTPQLILNQQKHQNPIQISSPKTQNNHTKTQYLNRRIRNELQRTHDEKEEAHDVLVAAKHFGQSQPGLGLNLVAVETDHARDLHEDERERDDGEDEEEKKNGVAVEEVVGLLGRVGEPEGLRVGQVSAQRGRGLVERLVRQHSRGS